MKIRVNRTHLEYLCDHNIFTHKQGVMDKGWLKVGDILDVDESVLIEPYSEFHRRPSFFLDGVF